MKYGIKILMATLLMALPFAFISCGSDDTTVETGPKVTEYTWMLLNTTPLNGTIAQRQAAFYAENAINDTLVAELKSLKINGATTSVDGIKQKFTVMGGYTETNDRAVKAAYYSAAIKWLDQVEALPANARITIKRGNVKIIDNETLR